MIVVRIDDITITPTDTIVCTGDQVLVSATSPWTDEFSWENNTGAEHTCTGDDLCESDLVTINAPAVTISAEAEFEGCPIMGSVTLNSVASPTVDFPDPPYCIGEPVDLNLAQSELPNTIYTWTANGNPLQPDPNFFAPTITPTTTAVTYIVTLENDFCPIVMDTIIIEESSLSTLTVPPNSVVCEGETVELTSTSNNLGNFTWDIGGEIQEFDVPSNSSTVSIFGGATTPVNITVTYSNDCPDTPISSSFIVNVDAGVPAVITLSPEPIEENGNECTYNEGEVVQMSQGGAPASLYEWVFRGEIIGTGPIDTLVLVEGGNLFLNLTSVNGCVLDDDKIIKVIPAIWTMPNAFTPDGDEVNDLFAPLIKGGIEIISFKIFNRWGREVYNNENGVGGWNGTFNDKPAPMDVYMYQIEILRPDKVTVEKKSGDVTLIR